VSDIIPLQKNDKLCPFMSGRPLMFRVEGVVTGAPTQGVTPMVVPCAQGKCALWYEGACSFKANIEVWGNIALGLTDVARGLEVFEPPSIGESPTTRLIEAINRLVEILTKRKE
jgi:hypothetical protein